MSIYGLLTKVWLKLPAILSQSFHVTKLLKQIPLRPMVFILPYHAYIENRQSNQDVEDNISHLMTLARLALEKGDTERASAILEMGIRICDEYEAYTALPYMYDILASINFALGHMDKAEHLLVSAIEKLVQNGAADNDSHIIDFQLRLARIYSAYANHDLAEIGFKDCLMKQQTKIFTGDTTTKTGMLYVNALFWYGLHKIRTEQPKIAKNLISSAYDYSMKIKGLSPYQEMVILYTLADLHMQLGDNNLALQNILSAIVLGNGIGSTDMPRCYLKLAQIYANLEVWDKAKQAGEEAVKYGGMFNDPVVMGEAEFVLQKIGKKRNK